MLNEKAIREIAEELPSLMAVYPMPDDREDGKCARLAFVFDPLDSTQLKSLRRGLHALELESDMIIDKFEFPLGACPPCGERDLLYARNDELDLDGSGYIPLNEDDFDNAGKLAKHEKFAAALREDHHVLTDIREGIAGFEREYDEGEAEYLDDWLSYLFDYPMDLLVRFLVSKSNHLKEIAPSSPILQFQRRWLPYVE